MSPIVPAVVIGGVVYVATQTDGKVTKPGGTTYAAPTAGMTVRQAENAPAILRPPQTPMTAKSLSRLTSALAGPPVLRVTNQPSANNIDAALKQKTDAIEAAAKKAYNDADAVAKAAAADKLNKELKLDPPLNGHETWDVVASVAGGAAGAAAGTALCGPLCGKVGALCGAYLGVKIEDLIAKNWDDCKNWLDDKVWGGIKGAATDAGNAVEDAFKAIF